MLRRFYFLLSHLIFDLAQLSSSLFSLLYRKETHLLEGEKLRRILKILKS